jgi:hypothetical protein
MKKIILIAGLILTIIGFIFGAEKEIEWTVYLGFPLVILFGGIGLTFITKRIEGVIAGLVLAAFWPVIWDLLKTAVSGMG